MGHSERADQAPKASVRRYYVIWDEAAVSINATSAENAVATALDIWDQDEEARLIVFEASCAAEFTVSMKRVATKVST